MVDKETKDYIDSTVEAYVRIALAKHRGDKLMDSLLYGVGYFVLNHHGTRSGIGPRDFIKNKNGE